MTFFRILQACAGTFLGLLLTASGSLAQDTATTGNASRGEGLFTAGYKCFACHGYDAITGARRLLPMRFDEAGFVAFVQNSPLAQMPRYPDAPAGDLADIYAYIVSMPIDEPAINEVPILDEIWQGKQRALAD